MVKDKNCGIVDPYTPPDPTFEFKSGASLSEGVSGQKEICTGGYVEDVTRGRIVKPRSETLSDEGAPEGGRW